MKIEIISGSARANSVTVRVAYALQKWLQENSPHEIGLIDCREHQLPVLQSVFSSVEKAPEAHQPLATRMFAADAFIWVSPEYNGSYSPAFKNLLDHFPKQLHKPIGIATASTGALGGMRAAQQLLLLSAAVFGITCPQLLLVPQVDKKLDETGKLLDENFHKSIHNFISEYLWLAGKITHPKSTE